MLCSCDGPEEVETLPFEDVAFRTIVESAPLMLEDTEKGTSGYTDWLQNSK